MDAIPVNPYNPIQAAQTAKTRLETLKLLCPRIKKMSLTSFSITADFPLPFTASHEITSILDNLPDSYTSLEIDMRHSGFIDPTSLRDQQTAHVCDFIRNILPQLVHLRLRRPEICSALFRVKMDGDDAQYETVSAPKLKVRIINLSLREPCPSSKGPLATACSDDVTRIPHVGAQSQFPSALSLLFPGLQDFACLNSNLQRLWLIVVQERDRTMPHFWAAWVRRDFLSDSSVPIPVANIGGFFNDPWLG